MNCRCGGTITGGYIGLPVSFGLEVSGERNLVVTVDTDLAELSCDYTMSCDGCDDPEVSDEDATYLYHALRVVSDRARATATVTVTPADVREDRAAHDAWLADVRRTT